MKKNTFFLLLALGAIALMAHSASAQQRPRTVVIAPPASSPSPVQSPD